jgi:hypothetical protein
VALFSLKDKIYVRVVVVDDLFSVSEIYGRKVEKATALKKQTTSGATPQSLSRCAVNTNISKSRITS